MHRIKQMKKNHVWMRKLKNESLYNNQPLYPTASKVCFVVTFYFVMCRTIKNKKNATQKRMVPNRKRKTVKNNLTTFYARNDREKTPNQNSR